MEIIKVKLNDKYPNEFITTVNGYVFKKDRVTEVTNDNKEVDFYLEQGFLEIVDEDIEDVDKIKTKKLVMKEEDSIEIEVPNEEDLNDDGTLKDKPIIEPVSTDDKTVSEYLDKNKKNGNTNKKSSDKKN